MIVIDSSVLIANLRSRQSRPLVALAGSEVILVGDLVLLEVLRGAINEEHATRIERDLRNFTIVQMTTPALALRAAANYRRLRRHGITIRSAVDMIIGTYCIEFGYELLHDDRDFAPMVDHLGLREYRMTPAS